MFGDSEHIIHNIPTLNRKLKMYQKLLTYYLLEQFKIEELKQIIITSLFHVQIDNFQDFELFRLYITTKTNGINPILVIRDSNPSVLT